MANYPIEHIIGELRTARAAAGLSQRDLGARSGIPQSHISQIENGAVDLRLSSLVELARVLELELMLVPRRGVPAVRSIVRGLARGRRGPQPSLAPAYSLDDEADG